jgi:hypothetical protein
MHAVDLGAQISNYRRMGLEYYCRKDLFHPCNFMISESDILSHALY